MLPDSVVATLRTSETAAFPDIASFAARVAGAPHKPHNATAKGRQRTSEAR
jgi:hypothetical protein